MWMDHAYIHSICYLDYHWSRSGLHTDLFLHVDDDCLAQLAYYGIPHVLQGHDGWYYLANAVVERWDKMAID